MSRITAKQDPRITRTLQFLQQALVELMSEKSYFEVLRTYYLRLIELERYLQKDLVFAGDPVDCRRE